LPQVYFLERAGTRTCNGRILLQFRLAAMFAVFVVIGSVQRLAFEPWMRRRNTSTCVHSVAHRPIGQGKQFPGPPFGNAVNSLPPDVAALYGEARSCMTVNSFTSAVLTCRKLLMHIAVEKKAPEGKSFFAVRRIFGG